MNQPRRYRSVLSNLQNALSLFLGRRRISKRSRFQVERPTMENARGCLVGVLARCTNSWPVTEERRARRPLFVGSTTLSLLFKSNNIYFETHTVNINPIPMLANPYIK